VQLLVRVFPVDLSWYVDRVEERARALPPGLVAVARDHAVFVQGIVRDRTLLERGIYIVVPWSTREAAARRGLTSAILALIGRLRGKRGGRAVVDEQQSYEAIVRRLDDRCDEASRQLGRAGVRTTRLDDLALAQLFRACWAPEQARTQRLRRELSEYTTLVVQTDVGSSSSKPRAPWPPTR